MRSRILVLLALAIVPARTSAGQEPPLSQPSAIPLELALALTASGGFGSEAEAQILIGSIPEWATQRAPLPSGWRVIGSAFFGTGVIGVVEVPTRGDSLIKEFEAHLVRNLWKLPAPSPDYGGGFRPAPTNTGRPPRRITLCRDAQVLTSWITRELPLSTTVAFRIVSAGVGSPCNQRVPDPRMLQYAAERGMPTLTDPSVPRETGPSTCFESGDGDGYNQTQTRYRTSMSADQILDHYAKQLADLGWVTPRATTTRSWTRPDSSGMRHVTLAVIRSPRDSTCVRVQMETTRERRAP